MTNVYVLGRYDPFVVTEGPEAVTTVVEEALEEGGRPRFLSFTTEHGTELCLRADFVVAIS